MYRVGAATCFVDFLRLVRICLSMFSDVFDFVGLVNICLMFLGCSLLAHVHLNLFCLVLDNGKHKQIYKTAQPSDVENTFQCFGHNCALMFALANNGLAHVFFAATSVNPTRFR